ncbi:MAG: glycosyltransferase family 4 protein [Burkholderiales bacterium]|nr:glycosyltransferase family 4 protein [Anaerolineae bacterium]
MRVNSRFTNAPKLCFVGPMVGQAGGHVTTQGYVLSGLFGAAGYPTLAVSTSLNRYLRLADIAATLIRRRRDIDIALIEVYSGQAFVIADVASAISRRMGYKTILTLHGGSLPDFIERHPDWTRRVLSRAHALVAPSAYNAQGVTPLGLEASVIPNVIDLADYPYRHRERVQPRLFWIRSFHPIYNPALALQVTAGLRADFPDTTLVMAGQDKGMQGEMQTLAHELGIADAVRFPGFLDRAGKAREGSAADIYLNTNRVDNMPVAIIEAGAMGLPVVATHVGGVPYLLQDGDNALLVPDDDAPSMIGAVRRLLDEPQLAERLSANGRVLAERSAWPTVRAQWDALFAQLRAVE